MPKLKIVDLIIQTREVEIPETCPKCGVSFLMKSDDDHAHLEQANYSDVYYRGGLLDGDEGEKIFEPGNRFGPTSGESSLVVGYSCGECQTNVVKGEEERSEA